MSNTPRCPACGNTRDAEYNECTDCGKRFCGKCGDGQFGDECPKCNGTGRMLGRIK